MTDSNGPNPLRAARSMLLATRRRPPAPTGRATIDHGDLHPILDVLRRGGIVALADARPAITEYMSRLEATDPDTLTRGHALAYWLNLYNAGALEMAAEAAAGETSVFRIPGAFERKRASVAGERLSLDDIEHGKVRRFGDPRIHGALVCSSASCPTLRDEPYAGGLVGRQLDEQMRSFLAAGGAIADRTASRLRLSRVFLWYGGDFTRPHRMPTRLPARKRTLVEALREWLDPELDHWIETTKPAVVFQPYDWSLACRVGG